MASESEPKRTKMIVLGVALVVVGLVAAIALWTAGGSRRTDAVANLARAPIGCDTTLDFSVAGEYLVFVESKGTFAEVRGDCEASGDYELGASRPQIDITVLDPDGRQLELDDRSDTVTYSTSDYVGRSVLALEVDEPGDHVMRVEASSTAEFAVAVGRDPNSGVALLRGAAVAVGLLGLVVGLLLAMVAGRKRQPAGPGWTPAQPQPQGVWPQAHPPYQQPTQPPYTQPTQPPYAQPGPGQGAPQPPAGPSPYHAQGTPPTYGGYRQPGQYPSSTQPHDDRLPQPPPPSAAPMWANPAPTVPNANPFAPPAGHPSAAPTGGVGQVPGQPGSGSGDGETGWPGDDTPTPPRGVEVTQADPSAAPTEVDRWNTSRPPTSD
jgi:hypothetical protein